MTRIGGELLQDSRPYNIQRVKKYELQTIKGMLHIAPASEEVITKSLDKEARTELTKDYISLLSKLAIIVRPLFGFLNSEGNEAELQYDSIPSLVTEKLGETILPFCNEYGLFNILTDRLDFFEHQSKGGMTRLSKGIAAVGVKENWAISAYNPILALDDGFPRGLQEYSFVAKRFFPMLSDEKAPCFIDEAERMAFVLQYAEPVEYILKNPRFHSMLHHVSDCKVWQGLNKPENCPRYVADGLSFEIYPNGDYWEMNAIPATMIEYLNALYVSNLLSRGMRVEVCHHPRCSSTFSTESLTRRYCSQAHMESALKWRYRLKKKKGEQADGQKRE